jgi:FixJ family two-component response regulator
LGVFVVDSDPSIREMISDLVRGAGWEPKTFVSAEEFLDQESFQGPGCLILEISLPGLSGLELQELLADRRDMPVIFVTRHVDTMTTVRAMKAGAMELLTKPFGKETLLSAIRNALELSRIAIDQDVARRHLRASYETLSARERDVMALVVCGLLNKQVAGRLGIAEITVKRHRGRAMRKMNAGSLPALVHMAATLGVARPTLGPQIDRSNSPSSRLRPSSSLVRAIHPGGVGLNPQ